MSLFGLLAAGCGEDEEPHACTDSVVYGLGVRVVGGADGAQCGVTVQAVDGDYEEDLVCNTEGADCLCTGADERPGKYEVSVFQGSTTIGTKSADVKSDELGCHPVPVELEFSL